MLERAPARGVLARGLGRSYGDAAQNAGGTVLDMRGFVGSAELDEGAGTLSIGAGASFDRILRHIVPRGWFLAVTPGTRFVTLGGAIANDVHGKNHHADGSFGRYVESFELLTASGELRMVSPDSDPDAWSATIGGLGLTGVILRATIRLLAIETSKMRVDTDRANDIDQLMEMMSAGDHRHRYSVAWVDCLARGSRLGRGVLTRGDHAAADELDPAAEREPLRRRFRSLPPIPPGSPNLTSLATARMFNELWYRRAPRHEQGHLVALDRFFYPLDAVGAWNRLYGRRGFLQHQFVVPFGHERVIVEAIELLGRSDCPSFLGVLKRFGPGRGMLSFPLQGWTLALDLPAGRAELGPILDGIDRRVAEAGGRIYLAKDARLDPGLLPDMYPELGRWAELRAAMDPAGIFRSDLERRLDLRSARRTVPV